MGRFSSARWTSVFCWKNAGVHVSRRVPRGILWDDFRIKILKSNQIPCRKLAQLRTLWRPKSAVMSRRCRALVVRFCPALAHVEMWTVCFNTFLGKWRRVRGILLILLKPYFRLVNNYNYPHGSTVRLSRCSNYIWFFIFFHIGVVALAERFASVLKKLRTPILCWSSRCFSSAWRLSDFQEHPFERCPNPRLRLIDALYPHGIHEIVRISSCRMLQRLLSYHNHNISQHTSTHNHPQSSVYPQALHGQSSSVFTPEFSPSCRRLKPWRLQDGAVAETVRVLYGRGTSLTWTIWEFGRNRTCEPTFSGVINFWFRWESIELVCMP